MHLPVQTQLPRLPSFDTPSSLQPPSLIVPPPSLPPPSTPHHPPVFPPPPPSVGPPPLLHPTPAPLNLAQPPTPPLSPPLSRRVLLPFTPAVALLAVGWRLVLLVFPPEHATNLQVDSHHKNAASSTAPFAHTETTAMAPPLRLLQMPLRPPPRCHALLTNMLHFLIYRYACASDV